MTGAKNVRYTYDYRNRLLQAEHSADFDQQTPTWTTVADYLCDGVNKTIEKHVDSDAALIHPYDGWRPVQRSLGERTVSPPDPWPADRWSAEALAKAEA